MSFIRAKEIPPRSGNWYDYEVETVRKGGKVIQRHIRYIGKSTRRASLSGGSTRIMTKEMPVPAPARVFKMKTPSRLVASALCAYYGGQSLDSLQQQFRQDHDLDMSESAFWNWVVRFTKEAKRQANRFRPHV